MKHWISVLTEKEAKEQLERADNLLLRFVPISLPTLLKQDAQDIKSVVESYHDYVARVAIAMAIADRYGESDA